MKNSFKIVDGIAYIDINSKGQILQCKIDEKDLNKVQITGTWHGHTDESGMTYVRGRDNGKLVFLHKKLMGFPKEIVDHIDRDTMNNCSSNLRVADDHTSSRNRGLNKNSTSGIKGIYQRNGKWIARIQLGSTRKQIGIFKDKHEAGRAYTKACMEYFNGAGIHRIPVKLEGIL